MANWYGIPGIEFHFEGPWADFTITYKGVRDDAGVIVEDTMWSRFSEDEEDLPGYEDWMDEHDRFIVYMVAYQDEVKYLIDMARGA